MLVFFDLFGGLFFLFVFGRGRRSGTGFIFHFLRHPFQFFQFTLLESFLRTFLRLHSGQRHVCARQLALEIDDFLRLYIARCSLQRRGTFGTIGMSAEAMQREQWLLLGRTLLFPADRALAAGTFVRTAW